MTERVTCPKCHTDLRNPGPYAADMICNKCGNVVDLGNDDTDWEEIDFDVSHIEIDTVEEIDE